MERTNDEDEDMYNNEGIYGEEEDTRESGQITVGEGFKMIWPDFRKTKEGAPRKRRRAPSPVGQPDFEWPTSPPVRRNAVGDLDPGTSLRSRRTVLKNKIYDMGMHDAADHVVFASSMNAVQFSTNCFTAGNIAKEFSLTPEAQAAAAKWIQIVNRKQREREATDEWRVEKEKRVKRALEAKAASGQKKTSRSSSTVNAIQDETFPSFGPQMTNNSNETRRNSSSTAGKSARDTCSPTHPSLGKQRITNMLPPSHAEISSSEEGVDDDASSANLLNVDNSRKESSMIIPQPLGDAPSISEQVTAPGKSSTESASADASRQTTATAASGKRHLKELPIKAAKCKLSPPNGQGTVSSGSSTESASADASLQITAAAASGKRPLKELPIKVANRKQSPPNGQVTFSSDENSSVQKSAMDVTCSSISPPSGKVTVASDENSSSVQKSSLDVTCSSKSPPNGKMTGSSAEVPPENDPPTSLVEEKSTKEAAGDTANPATKKKPFVPWIIEVKEKGVAGTRRTVLPSFHESLIGKTVKMSTPGKPDKIVTMLRVIQKGQLIAPRKI